MTIFATGSTGYLGRHLPPSVTSLSLRLDRDSDYVRKDLKLENSCVIHLAGVVGRKVDQDPEGSSLINIQHSAALAKSMAEQGVRKFVYVSTGHVYGPSATARTETDIPMPVTEYGRQKWRAEQEIEKTLSGTGTALIVARVFSILDTGMPAGTLGATLDIAQKAGRGCQIDCSDDIRDFLKVKDVIDSLLALANSEISESLYNICSSMPVSVKDAATAYLMERKPLSGKLDIQFLSGHSDIPYLWGDNTKICAFFRSGLTSRKS